MSEQYELTVSDYLEIAKRRWFFLVFPFVAIFSVSIIVAISIPAVFKSSGTILVESQQIPDSLIRSTVTSYADERIQLIQQRVMTRENLLRIINKYGLFPRIRDELTVSEQVAMMRENISISKVSGNFGRKGVSTVAFSLGFEDESPRLANQVANELVTLFLEENVRTRTERASETTEFLTEEASKLKRDLETIEDRIAAYKQENSNALPEHLDLHLNMLERTEASLKEINRSIKEAEEESRFLEIEASAIRLGVANTSGPQVVTPEQAVTASEAELASLRSRYSDKHPDVKRLLKKIEELKADAAASSHGSSAVSSSSAQDIGLARVEAKSMSVSKRIASLRKQYSQLVTKRQELEETIIQTPQVDRALTSLNRDYENTAKKYKEIQAKEMEARLAESLEQEKKAERFSLLEPPVLPEKPIKPNRKKMMALGFFLALAASLGLVVLLEMADKRLRGADALALVLQERPLVVIPYITTSIETAGRKRLHRWGLVATIVVAIIGVLAVHFFYMPLDRLLIKVLARLG